MISKKEMSLIMNEIDTYSKNIEMFINEAYFIIKEQ